LCPLPLVLSLGTTEKKMSSFIFGVFFKAIDEEDAH